MTKLPAVAETLSGGRFAMDINRNQFFMVGVIVLLLGVQFRMVDAFVLNEPTRDFLNKHIKKESAGPELNRPFFVSAPAPTSSSFHTLRPPDWVGWALLSVGGVLILHSLAMPKPG